MKAEELLENYEQNQDELSADLWLLGRMLKQEVGGSYDRKEYGKILNRFCACADFRNDPVVDERLAHALDCYQKLSLAEWAIRSRSKRQRMILSGLYVERKTWQELELELGISQATISRERRKAIHEISHALASFPSYERK